MNTFPHNHQVPKDFGKAFIIGILLNSLFIVAEVIYGMQANSLTLLADAGHNASDVLGLFLAWGAFLLAKRKPSARYTYGLQSFSIIAALANAIFLLITIGGIGWEAIQRLGTPQETIEVTVIIVALIGALINGFTAWLFMSGCKRDLNIRGAFLHMLADAIISLGIAISALVILKTGWVWLDPLISLFLSIIIIISTLELFKDSINLALHAVPKGIDSIEVKKYLLTLKEVQEVHDLHIWAMSASETAMSAHLLTPQGHPGDAFFKKITAELEEQFNIGHVTLQIELGDLKAECALAQKHDI